MRKLLLLLFMLSSTVQAISIEQHLINESKKANKSLPAMIDKDTRMDSTLPEGKKLYYRYTMIHLDGKDVLKSQINSFFSEKREQLIKFSCSEPNTVFLLNNGVMFHYIYAWNTGKHIKTIIFSKKDC